MCGDESYDTYLCKAKNLNQNLITFTLIIKDVINSSLCKNLNYYCTQGFFLKIKLNCGMESLSISYSEIVKISRIYTRKTKILPNLFVQKVTKFGERKSLLIVPWIFYWIFVRDSYCTKPIVGVTYIYIYIMGKVY